jgi:uncharacterized protein (DUF952 family)
MEAADCIVHLCTRPRWEAAVREGVYQADSLETEGFIHCSRPEQILASANRYYRGLEDVLLLWIDPAKVETEVRWEEAHGELFPHIYGPLNLDAVLDVTRLIADEDGIYRRLK